MLFKSGIMTQASGSIGGITASHNRGGMYFRARTIPTDPATMQQVTIRGIMTAMVNHWNNVLTTIERDSWNLYASMVPVIGPLGDPITISGQNHFVRTNVPNVQVGGTVIDSAPTQFDTGDQGIVTLENVTAATDEYDVTFDNTEEWAIADGGFLIIQQSRPQNPSINFFKGPWRFAFAVPGALIAPTSPETVASQFVLSEGQRLWIRTRALSPDGRLSAAAVFGPVDVAA